MRILKTATVTEQIGELDALVDDLVRKPRNPPVTKLICPIPGGCLMEPVVSDLDVFVGFFTIAGTLTNLIAQLPLDAKPATITVKSIVGNVTHSVDFQISKGQNSIAGPIDIEANSKIIVSVHTDLPISSALFGYVFTPKVS